ncbi:uncharacterized protein LOC143202384 isoform X2 [Rhynchophorus ferrugineus]
MIPVTIYSSCSSINKGYYSFEYSIDTNDIVSHHSEEGHEDFAKGYYSFVQPDGRIRSVHYQVDGHKGFRVFVKYRSLTNNQRGPLQFPRDYIHPIYLLKPVYKFNLNKFTPQNIVTSY